jgi:hypothetical protein
LRMLFSKSRRGARQDVAKDYFGKDDVASKKILTSWRAMNERIRYVESPRS